MLKPDTLRAALTAACADLRTDPKRLVMMIDKGSIRATAVPGLSFEYRYTLQLLLLDFAGHPDQIMVPLIAWLFVNQNELLANPDKSRDGIGFNAELLDSGRVDLEITLVLTERVRVVRREDGGHDVTHLPEPPVEERFAIEQDADGNAVARLWHLFNGPEEMLRWEAPGIITPYPPA
jgi:hypothetical protein